MAATAAARRVAASPGRRATANRPALKPRPRRAQPARRGTAPRRRRRSQVTPVVGFVPVAVGRTAGAVGGLADSGLVVRLTRGRLWIGALGVLLVGIVALNVLALSMNASSSKVARAADGLRHANSALQARLAGELSNEKVQLAAGGLGLAYPAPESIRYVTPREGDAARAARRLASGELTLGTAPATTPPAEPETAAPVPAPAVPAE